MSQFDFGNIDPDNTSGTDLSESILEPWRDALHSCHQGSTRPNYANAGMMWIDDSATPWLIKVYTGSTDSIIGSIAPSTGVFNVRSDVISEASSGTGVTVDGVLLKDGSIGSSGSPVGTVYANTLSRFPNVNADVTATDEELNKLDGYTGTTADLNEAASSEKWERISSQTVSGASQVDITGLDNTYDKYKVVVRNLTRSNGSSLKLRTSSDGGSTFDSSSDDYTWAHIDTLVNTSSSGAGSTEAQLTDFFSNSVSVFGEILVEFLGDGSASGNEGEPHIVSYLTAGRTVVRGGSTRDSNVVINAIRLFQSTGTLSGTFIVYGWIDGS